MCRLMKGGGGRRRPCWMKMFLFTCDHRLNMEADLQSLFRLHVTWCAQLYSLAETPHTVKRVDEVVRHPHLVTQDQFTQVLKKVSDIPEENFTINIKHFQQNFTFVELLRYKHIPNVELFRWWPSNLSKCFTNVELLRQRLIVSKLTPTGR